MRNNNLFTDNCNCPAPSLIREEEEMGIHKKKTARTDEILQEKSRHVLRAVVLYFPEGVSLSQLLKTIS